MKTRLLLLLLLLTNICLYGQQWKAISKTEALSILSKMKGWYAAHPDYSVNINHTSYIGYSNSTPHEQLNGYAIVHGNFYHSNMLGIETIQNADYKIVIDTADKSVIVSYPGNPNSELNNLPDSASLRLVTSCYVMKHDKMLSLRLDYKSGCRVERNEITLDNDYKLNKIVFYFHHGSYDEDIEESDSEKPRVVVNYSNYNLKNVITENDFNTKNYILQGDSNKLTLAAPFIDFEILDSRIK